MVDLTGLDRIVISSVNFFTDPGYQLIESLLISCRNGKDIFDLVYLIDDDLYIFRKQLAS